MGAGRGPQLAIEGTRHHFRVQEPAVLKPVDETRFWVSTNASAQYGLAAIQCLALAGEPLP